eukprot:EG_transcript_56795
MPRLTAPALWVAVGTLLLLWLLAAVGVDVSARQWHTSPASLVWARGMATSAASHSLRLPPSSTGEAFLRRRASATTLTAVWEAPTAPVEAAALSAPAWGWLAG